MQQKFPTISFGLYRDDGLGSYQDVPGPDRDRIRKNIIKLFKDNNLNITIDINKNIVNFLDCSFNLDKGTFGPYKKPNNDLLYISSDSNHPPNIKKQLPKMLPKMIYLATSSSSIKTKTATRRL